MTRNKIYAIVEGHGEANPPRGGGQPAVTVLISKLLQELECWHIFADQTPYRMRSCGDFFNEKQTLENVIRIHKMYPDCCAILILVDMDENCPREMAQGLVRRIESMESLPFSVVIVCANSEYEAWFLASLESIHDQQTYPDDPEAIRGAKGWLKKHFEYEPTNDQSAYTRRLDVQLAKSRSRSFQRLYHAFEEIVAADAQGTAVITPNRFQDEGKL